MKSSTVFLILALVVVSVGLAGCIGGGLPAPVKPVSTQVTTTIVNEVPGTMTAIPVTTAPPTAAVTTMQPTATSRVTTAAAQVSADDVRNHFLEIAFYPSNRLERLNNSAGGSRVVISAMSAVNEDIGVLEKAAKDFSDASPTVKVSENIKQTGGGDILIKFLPEDGLRAISLDDAPDAGPFPEALTRGELYQGSTLAAKVLRGTIYINANLKGDARKHILVKSLMYEMGMIGETTKYPDSVFSATENTNVNLSPVDKKAITMLYAQGFANGMTAEDLRKVIYIP